ncbi:MAG: anaerobic ribonucleoside-triphosphate reductase activating protein [Clostridia bacterium]|nr:anaerobic ribonucleoside-triphosphate reductase activating protein [Clostridia bacterium]MBO5440037.1 anaerobic ribonucleoside-triphosphate reductase activating protein [Clostridia bacterium]
MLIGGFQKMTMLDYPGKVACTIFTYGCNFRCPFCHNATLVIDEAELFSEDEILAYINKRKGILDGVCISGGEPLLQPDIFEFISKIKETGLLVKLDTNGSYPDKLKEAIDRGLIDYVAMDIKTSKENYSRVCDVNVKIEDIEKSVQILLENKVDYEFRTTVVREMHTREDFEKISSWIKGAKRYFLQCFKDNENLIGNNLSAYTASELESFLEVLKCNINEVSLRGV